MLNFSQMSLRRGSRELLRDVSFTVHQGQKVGITGANGAGKSSLFALIRGELAPDRGEFSRPPNAVVAHVAQETPAVSRPAIEYVIDGDKRLRNLEKEIAVADATGHGERLGRLYSELEAIDGYTANSRAAQMMHGLGFLPGQETVPVKDLSGGWRMRLNLAQALMCRSDILLLDEPTNHLDLEAVIWLEDWLRAYPGTLLLISHDRDFLDRVVTHVAHIEDGRIALYTGNYSEFEVRRAEQLAQQQSAYVRQQGEIARMRRFVARFGAKASKARQAQSRVKALERMEIISQAHVDSPFDFHFSPPARLPEPLLSLKEANVGYAERVVLRGVSLNLSPGDRVGLLGYNGAGKSTLIKLIAGQLTAQSGERTEAKDLSIGYFAQHQLEQLDGAASPLLHLQRIDRRATEQELRTFLGGFAFAGDMATSPVAPFSGGEKARLVLALIVYQKPNLLLLDEPTNHLDLEMRLALTTALQEFEGALVLVSHDRHLLRTVADSLLLVADGRVTLFDGDLEDYRQWLRDQRREDAPVPMANESAAVNKKRQRQDAAELRRRLQPLRAKVQSLEKEMDRLQAISREQQARLADTAIYQEQKKEALRKLLAEQAQTTEQLRLAEEQWLEASEALDAASAAE